MATRLHHSSCPVDQQVVAELERAAARWVWDLPGLRWVPWVGENYAASTFHGKKVLVLGVSHYEWCRQCSKERIARPSTLTCRCVAERVILDEKNSIQHWRNVEYALLGAKSDNQERATFWHSIAYYNFVQDIVGYYAGGDGPRPQPSPAMWRAAHEPFLGVLDRLMPDLVVVLGNDLWRKLHEEGPKRRVPTLRAGGKDLRRSVYVVNGKNVVACRVRHPAAGLGRPWHPVLMKAVGQL